MANSSKYGRIRRNMANSSKYGKFDEIMANLSKYGEFVEICLNNITRSQRPEGQRIVKKWAPDFLRPK